MKKVFFAFVFCFALLASAQDEAPESWITLDPEADKTQGVSADKVHQLMKNRESRTVIVAVIDSGVDIEHEDLQGKIWVNKDEIAGNGIDDDKNGYIDDVNGWNFIGGKDGENVDADTYELTREYARLKQMYGDVQKPSKKQKEEFVYWKVVEEEYTTEATKAIEQYDFYNTMRANTIRFNSLLLAYLDVEKLTLEEVQSIASVDKVVQQAKQSMAFILTQLGDTEFDVVVDQLNEAVEHFEVQAKYGYNTGFNSREIVGDNWDDPYEIGYGNNNVQGPDASHGTHVSGIIAAVRDNDLGMRGIAKNVIIMPVRAVPNGDERDKDVANAIRYAVDNGAHIINMSFGKSYVYRKNVVDEAIKYAAEKGVLMIHAAGNDGEDLDQENNYPTPMLTDTERASSWIEVGASSWGEDENFVGGFSNYGKTTVDIFAPGVRVYSTTPGSEYDTFDGTSMASPATAGVAAVVMSYFPELSAEEVREVLTESSRKFGDLEVIKPGSDEKVKFSELSITGGLVNAVEAVKLAEQKSKELQAGR